MFMLPLYLYTVLWICLFILVDRSLLLSDRKLLSSCNFMGWLWSLIWSASSWGVPNLWCVSVVWWSIDFDSRSEVDFLTQVCGLDLVSSQADWESSGGGIQRSVGRGCFQVNWAHRWWWELKVRWFFEGFMMIGNWFFFCVVFGEKVWGCGFDFGVEFVLVFL